MKFLKMLIIGLWLTPTMSMAMNFAESKAAEFDLNTASPEQNVHHRLGTKLMRETVHDLSVIWDFSKQGGAIGTQNLWTKTAKQAYLPNKAMVIGCYIDVITTPTTSASGTLAFSTGQATADLKAATAAASYTGIVACIPTGSAASSIKLTADRSPTLAIATGALTAGKIALHVQYLLSE